MATSMIGSVSTKRHSTLFSAIMRSTICSTPMNCCAHPRFLIPGGQLVSAIPLDGEAENPIFRQALSLAREPDRIQRSDMFLMLGGHPYKTNASEFAETLPAAGFQAVRVAYRPWSSRNMLRLADEDALSASRATHMKLHGASTRLLSSAVNRIFSNNLPLAALRPPGAVDSRWPIG